jgi:hypothetical protein
MAAAWGKSFGKAWGKSWGVINDLPIPIRPQGGAAPIWWKSNPAGVRRKKRDRDEETVLLALTL